MNHGTAFEHQVAASLGTDKHPEPPGRWVWNIPSPQHRRPEQSTSEGKAKIRFAPKMPFDLEVKWPRWRWLDRPGCGLPAEGRSVPDGSWDLCAECKSTDVPRLSFDVLWTKATKKKPATSWQRDQLVGVAGAGAFAGVLWEFRDQRRGDGGIPLGCRSVVFIPIYTWLSHEASGTRKSLSWAVAVRDGIVVERDAGRGTKKPYWKLVDLLHALERGIQGGLF